MSIALTLLRQNPIIQTPSSNLPFASSSMMDCLTAKPVGTSGEIIGFSFPTPPSKTGLRRRGKKTYSKIEADDYLDWAFENVSGYIAVDEVYDGPFCVLSVVDNREYKRLTFRVLDHAPTAEDILELLQSFQKILRQREVILHGITTDGSSLYTEPVRTVFPGVPHQICEFHVKKEINKAILKAVAQVRRELDKTKVKRSKRGRPSTMEDKATVRRNERIDAKMRALFEHRYLFVRKTLTKRERETLHQITTSLPELRKLREIVDEMYRLYDRRCCRATALQKLRKLRDRLKRFKRLSKVLSKLESPTVDRSLVFLDDKDLPSTSNAVERGNRRFRKMQKTVYRVRTHGHIRDRVSLDMFRDSRLPSRRRALQWLHDLRDG
jgi:DNA replication initiation complex subunit (GINS family)